MRHVPSVPASLLGTACGPDRPAATAPDPPSLPRVSAAPCFTLAGCVATTTLTDGDDSDDSGDSRGLAGAPPHTLRGQQHSLPARHRTVLGAQVSSKIVRLGEPQECGPSFEGSRGGFLASGGLSA